MRKLKIYLYPFLAVSLTAVILTFPADCLALALKGLTLWFERMIPTLFPFMVLSGIMIRMELTGAFVKALKPVLGPLFRVRGKLDAAVFCVYDLCQGGT